MSRLARIASILAALSLCSTGAFAASRSVSTELQGPPASSQAADSMSHYRTLAGEALSAFKSGDKAGAKTKARDLEKAWDSEQKALRAKSPDLWKSVDDAMDAFVKPLMKGGSPDAASVQAAYDAFIAKLDAAAKG
jgi:hypothetical protein